MVALERIIVAVKSERNGAVAALCSPSTIAAQHELRVPTTIKKQDGLLSQQQPLTNGSREPVGKKGAPNLELFAQVHNLHMRHWSAVDTLIHVYAKNMAETT
jgi:hypothetical protein